MIKSESDCLDYGLPCKYELLGVCIATNVKTKWISCINTAKKNYVRIV